MKTPPTMLQPYPTQPFFAGCLPLPAVCQPRFDRTVGRDRLAGGDGRIVRRAGLACRTRAVVEPGDQHRYNRHYLWLLGTPLA